MASNSFKVVRCPSGHVNLVSSSEPRPATCRCGASLKYVARSPRPS